MEQQVKTQQLAVSGGLDLKSLLRCMYLFTPTFKAVSFSDDIGKYAHTVCRHKYNYIYIYIAIYHIWQILPDMIYY